MNTIVVYDSQFGNTGQIAQAIADTLAQFGQARAVHVHQADPAELLGADLLVLGSPTQAWNQTRAMQTFLDRITTQSLTGLKTACFDTRMHVPWWMRRFAAGQIARKLHGKGADPILPPEGFFVTGKEGPLQDGELERAATWARMLHDRCLELATA